VTYKKTEEEEEKRVHPLETQGEGVTPTPKKRNDIICRGNVPKKKSPKKKQGGRKRPIRYWWIQGETWGPFLVLNSLHPGGGKRPRRSRGGRWGSREVVGPRRDSLTGWVPGRLVGI